MSEAQPASQPPETQPEKTEPPLETEKDDASSTSSTHRHRDVLKGWVKNAGDELLKGKLKIEHALGLGHQPNVIPPGEAVMHSDVDREVQLAWHPVAGFAGKWFAEKTGVGRLITSKIKSYPDPTQHWGVIVGDYVHQLWMDEHLDVIYINEKLGAGADADPDRARAQWPNRFPVGRTRFNDEALRQAAEMTIFNMRQKHASYNLITNNCQNFALLFLDAIQIGKHRQFGSSFAIYQRATGAGTIADLFAEHPAQDEEDAAAAMDAEEADEGDAAGKLPAPTEAGGEEQTSYFNSILKKAKKVMDENTTKLDVHHDVN